MPIYTYIFLTNNIYDILNILFYIRLLYVLSSLVTDNRRQELTNLYGKIAKEFPFLVKQGLLRPGDRKVSIDDLLSMTVFGQPKMGKK